MIVRSGTVTVARASATDSLSSKTIGQCRKFVTVRCQWHAMDLNTVTVIVTATHWQ